MNSFERVVNAFHGRKADKIPVFHIGFSSQVASRILGHEAYIGGGIQQWREATALWNGSEAHREYLEQSYEDAFEIAKICDMDIVRTSYWRLAQKPAKKINVNEFLYGDENNWVIRKFHPETELFVVTASYPTKKEVTFDDIEQLLDKQEKRLPEYDPSAGFDAIKAAFKVFGRDKALRANAGHIDIPMESIWLEAICLRPDLIQRHLDLQVRKAVININYLSTLGIRMIFGGGDLASNSGPIYSPETFRSYLLPAVRRISEACHLHNMYYLYCSDGNLWPIAEDLFGSSGVDGYYEIDRRAGMDLDKLRIQFPNLTLIGANISSYTLHKGSKEDVIAESRSCIEAAKKYGKIVVGCSNYLVPGTPVENAWAMIETIDKYR